MNVEKTILELGELVVFKRFGCCSLCSSPGRECANAVVNAVRRLRIG